RQPGLGRTADREHPGARLAALLATIQVRSPAVMPDLVLEIGIEEVPASAVVPALGQMRELGEQQLKRERVGPPEVRTVGTPRRVVAVASGGAERQADAEIEIGGPPARVAFDAAGDPTPAAEGFARKNQVTLADLQVRPTPRGEYVFALK